MCEIVGGSVDLNPQARRGQRIHAVKKDLSIRCVFVGGVCTVQGARNYKVLVARFGVAR